jgi:DNA-binding NarL/FixJ family response regulator
MCYVPAKRLRVFLVDPLPLFRAGVCRLLQDINGLKVVGEASDARQAIRGLRRQPADVLLMAIIMPRWNGVDATARICRLFPSVRVLVFSEASQEDRVARSLRAGASGYLLKSADPAELGKAIRAVAGGETYLSPTLSRREVQRYLQAGRPGRRAIDRLTPRQREVLQLLAEGSSMREVAKEMVLSVKTVETHRARLMARLRIDDLPGLVRCAIRDGLVKA